MTMTMTEPKQEIVLYQPPTDDQLAVLCEKMVKQGGLPPRADGKPWTPDAALLIAKAAQAFGIIDPASALRSFYFSKSGNLEPYAAFELDCIYLIPGAQFMWVDHRCTWEQAVALYMRPNWPEFPLPKDIASGDKAVDYETMLTLRGWHKKVYTLADAEREGFMKPGRTRDGKNFTTTWQRFTRRMLRWNLVRELSKEAFPEVRAARTRAVSNAQVTVSQITEKYPSLLSEPDPADIASAEPQQIESAIDSAEDSNAPDLGHLGDDANPPDAEPAETLEELPFDSPTVDDDFDPPVQEISADVKYVYQCWAKDKAAAEAQRNYLRSKFGDDALELLKPELVADLAAQWRDKLAAEAPKNVTPAKKESKPKEATPDAGKLL